MDSKRLITAVIMIATMAVMFTLAMRRESGAPVPVQVAGMGPSVDSFSLDPGEPVSSEPDVDQAPPSIRGTVGRNETFFDLMQKSGFSPGEIYEISKVAKPVYNFRKIYPGQTYEIFKDAEGRFESLRFTISSEKYIEVSRHEGELSVNEQTFPYEISIREASGIITHSLFASLSDQGLPIDLAIKLADIYAWDIDFFTQIQKNDYFRVIYEEKVMTGGPVDGEPGIGNIIAAEFNTSGENHYAFLFANEDDFADYYDDEGKSLRKQLLRAPLTFSRISSNFSRSRKHPVLHTYRPHLGIDYAAPVGTPVMSTGDGTIMTASRTRANGNYIKVKHNSNYISYYLHLSKFAKGIHAGVRVKQGQLIGYVGQTGLASGPHLDYRVKKNGKFVNPRNLKLPPAEPVREDKREAYAIHVNDLIDRLRVIPIRDPRGEYFAEGESASDPESAGESRRTDARSSAAD